LLCLHAFSDVARNLGEPDQRPLVVPDRLDDGVGPEAGAILSDAPALSLMPAMGPNGLQYSLGKAACSIFRGKESGKVLANDLNRLVALDPLGASIPGCNESVRVEHVNGIVGESVKQQFDPISIHWIALGD
jgi:hypothetical protein